jgi:hypothetical protein
LPGGDIPRGNKWRASQVVERAEIQGRPEKCGDLDQEQWSWADVKSRRALSLAWGISLISEEGWGREANERND